MIMHGMVTWDDQGGLMSTSAVTTALLSPSGRAAVAAGSTGTIIRLARQALDWTQHELARRSGYSQATISRLEREVSRAARDMEVLADLATALGIAPSALGLLLPGVDEPSRVDTVDRRAFLTSTATMAAAAMLPASVATPGRIGAAEVAQCWNGLHRLVQLGRLH